MTSDATASDESSVAGGALSSWMLTMVTALAKLSAYVQAVLLEARYLDLRIGPVDGLKLNVWSRRPCDPWGSSATEMRFSLDGST